MALRMRSTGTDYNGSSWNAVVGLSIPEALEDQRLFI